MRGPGLLRYLAILGLLPAFAMVFWMAALLASHVPGLLILGVNVHGLSLASYEADWAPRTAPVSLRVLQDAQQDAGGAPGASPSATTPGRIPFVARPTPSQTASPAPTRLPLPAPIPVPTPSPSPAPSLSPVPLPLPLPTVSSLPPVF